MPTNVYSLGKERRWYPVVYTEKGTEPSHDPADWEPLIDRLVEEAVLFVRAVGAEHHFRHRINAQPEDARGRFKAWTEDYASAGGSHTMRTIGRIAYTDTAQSAVDIFFEEHARVLTDLPAGTDIASIARSEVGYYDQLFIGTGASIIEQDPNFNTAQGTLEALRARMDVVREEILADPDYYRPFATST